MADASKVQGRVQTCLSKVTLKDLVSHEQRILVLEHNQSVGDALQILAKRKVLSAPVVINPGLEDLESDTSGDPVGPQLLGWVDVKDILSGFLAHLREKHGTLPHSMLQLMTELELEGPKYCSKTLITITGDQDRELVYQADSNATLLSTIKELFLPPKGHVVHRLAIFDAHGIINNIVSQLDVIKYLRSHPAVLGDLLTQSVESLGLLHSTGPLVALEASLPTLLAYDRMLKADVTGAPILSDKGHIIANLSVSDLRCIQPDHLGVLALPVAEFLALAHRTAYLGYSARGSESAAHPFFAQGPPTAQPTFKLAVDTEQENVRLFACARDTPLKDVLAMMADNRVHRVYCVDPDANPQVVGVMTPTDIIKLAATH